MQFRFNYAPALLAGAAIGSLISSSSTLAAEGGWRSDGCLPVVVSSNDSHKTPVEPQAAEQNEDDSPAQILDVQFTQPGREAWLADCRSRVANRDRSAGLNNALGTDSARSLNERRKKRTSQNAKNAGIDQSEARKPDRDECEVHLEDYYARYAASVRNWINDSGYMLVRAHETNGELFNPAIMVPIQMRPVYTHTIEYVYDDVPERDQTKRASISSNKFTPDKHISIR